MRYDEDKILTPTKKAIYIATYNAITDDINQKPFAQFKFSMDYDASVLDAIRLGVYKAVEDNEDYLIRMFKKALKEVAGEFLKKYAIETLKKEINPTKR